MAALGTRGTAAGKTGCIPIPPFPDRACTPGRHSSGKGGEEVQSWAGDRQFWRGGSCLPFETPTSSRALESSALPASSLFFSPPLQPPVLIFSIATSGKGINPWGFLYHPLPASPCSLFGPVRLVQNDNDRCASECTCRTPGRNRRSRVCGRCGVYLV